MGLDEKRFIPGTNPDWGRELPKGYDNSLVDAAGHNWDNEFNFDEPGDNDEDEPVSSNRTSWEDLSKQKMAENEQENKEAQFGFCEGRLLAGGFLRYNHKHNDRCRKPRD